MLSVNQNFSLCILEKEKWESKILIMCAIYNSNYYWSDPLSFRSLETGCQDAMYMAGLTLILTILSIISSQRGEQFTGEGKVVHLHCSFSCFALVLIFSSSLAFSLHSYCCLYLSHIAWYFVRTLWFSNLKVGFNGCGHLSTTNKQERPSVLRMCSLWIYDIRTWHPIVIATLLLWSLHLKWTEVLVIKFQHHSQSGIGV